MNKKLGVNIIHKVRRLEAGMTRVVERAAREWSRSGADEPLEVAQAVVDAVFERLEPAPRGRYVFPYNRVHVTIAASSRDVKARFAAVFESEPTLQDRINARLQEAACDPSGVQLVVTYAPRPAPDWVRPEFHVDFTRGAPAPVAEPASAKASAGKAEKAAPAKKSAAKAADKPKKAAKKK